MLIITFYFYPNKPKMSDCEIIALSLLGETSVLTVKTTCLGSSNLIISMIFPISLIEVASIEEGGDWET